MIDQRDSVLQDGSNHFQNPSALVVSQTNKRRFGKARVDALADYEDVAPSRQHVEFRKLRMSTMDAFMDPDEILPHGAPFVKRSVIRK